MQSYALRSTPRRAVLCALGGEHRPATRHQLPACSLYRSGPIQGAPLPRSPLRVLPVRLPRRVAGVSPERSIALD